MLPKCWNVVLSVYTELLTNNRVLLEYCGKLWAGSRINKKINECTHLPYIDCFTQAVLVSFS
jgi:hypothetical protein